MSFLALLKAWLIIVPVMIANGAFREVVLRPALGPKAADIVSAALGIAIIVVLTRYLLRPMAGRAPSQLLRASVTLVILTVAFEFLFGRYVDRRSWSELIENYAIWRGHLWPLVLATLAFMPFLWGRWSLKEPRHAR
jgi:hypothetical protein